MRPLKQTSQRKNKIRFHTIRSRMTFGYICLFLLTVIPMSIVIYGFIARAFIEKNEEAHSKVLNAAEEILEDKFNIYAENARMIMSNQTVQNTLVKEDHSTGIYMNLERNILLRSVGRSFTNSISDLGGIYLFDNQWKFFYQDANVSSQEAEKMIASFRPEDTIWYKEALKACGKELFIGEDVLFGKDNMISCVKVINRLNTRDKIGLMIMTIRKEAFRSVVGLFPTDKDMYILKYEDHLICQNKDESISEWKDLQTVLSDSKNENYAVTRHNCRSDGWELYHIVEKKNLFTEAGTVRMIIAAFSLTAIILMAVLSVWQAYRITKPLSELQENIQAVGRGERAFHNVFSDDDIGLIGQEFQKMVTEKLELKERVTEEELLRKESQLQLLQSQINPHFLYNTLETLYWMAIDKGAEEVADLTQSLSEIFKISLNNGEELISVRDEIRFIEDYLHIQNVRFEGKFLVCIQISEKIQDLLIIKQILQPFVENAIYHGLEPKLKKGSLSITGKQEGEFLVFTISDDGVGVPRDVDVTKGYAVSNVIQRVKLHYGDMAEVQIFSEPEKGTNVKILLPLQEVKNC